MIPLPTTRNFIGVGGVIILLLIWIITLAVFGFGVTTGGSAALNESVSVEKQHTALNTVRSDTLHSISNSSSNVNRMIAEPLVKGVLDIAIPAGHLGITLGYQYPAIAQPVVNWIVRPLMFLSIILVVFVEMWRYGAFNRWAES